MSTKSAQRGSTTIVYILIVFLGILGTLFLLRKPLEYKVPAVSPGGVGKVSLQPATLSPLPGDRFATLIRFRTGGAAISTIALRITYPYLGTTPELDVVDAAGAASSQVYPDAALTSSGNWSFPVKSVVKSAGKVTIDLAAVYTDGANPALGFTSGTDLTLATIYFKANSIPATNPIVLSFDSSQSKMLTKSDPPTDILDSPTGASYTIAVDTTAPTTISDLRSTATTTNSVTLVWTAPSDSGNGSSGKASSYDLRFSTSVITSANFGSATAATGLPVPATAGTTQTFTVPSLTSGTTYYFAIKSKDANNNVSLISNVASQATAVPASTLTFGFRLQEVPFANISQPITVTITNGTVTQTYTPTVTSDSNGVFRATNMALGTLPIAQSGSNYDIYLKDSSHLRKRMGTSLVTFNWAANTTSPTLDNTTLKAGDLNGDNTLNINDVSAMLAQYTTLTTPVSSGNKIYDLNQDLVFDIYDISVLLSNYVELQVAGD